MDDNPWGEPVTPPAALTPALESGNNTSAPPPSVPRPPISSTSSFSDGVNWDDDPSADISLSLSAVPSLSQASPTSTAAALPPPVVLGQPPSVSDTITSTTLGETEALEETPAEGNAETASTGNGEKLESMEDDPIEVDADAAVNDSVEEHEEDKVASSVAVPPVEEQQSDDVLNAGEEDQAAEESSAAFNDEREVEGEGSATIPTLPPFSSSAVLDQGPPMDDFDDDDGFGDDDDGFGEFGDMAGGGEGDDDDGFGDFGDTNDDAFAAASPPPLPAPASFPATASSTNSVPPLRLDFSSPIAPQLQPFLTSLYPLASTSVSEEPERQVAGPGQILVTESSRSLLTSLSSMPPLKPLDWRRSKIRRAHLTALGVPINLDDTAEIQSLPALNVPSRRGTPVSFANARPATPPAPLLNMNTANSLLSHTEEALKFMSLADLQKLKEEMVETTTAASNALTQALMEREKQSGDAEIFNRMIQDLVTAAAKMKTTGGISLGRTGSNSGSRWGRKSSGSPAAVR